MLRPKVMALYENANLLLKKVKLDLSVKEEEFVRQSLSTRAIPSPNLLIKAHKTINENWEFPTRLVIPATIFTATFSKIVYLGIKRCPDKGRVNYSRNSIVQDSYLKETLEEMGLKKEEVTIASVDAIKMYPSIKLATIKKAVRFFARKLTSEVKKTINLCLDLIQFGMSSTLIFFDGEYYEYHGGEREEQGLAIGGYESTLLANLVASYLFEKAKPIFRPKIYQGIYRDDGLVIFKGKKKASDIKDWIEKLQQTVNLAAGNQHLKFTAEIWIDGESPPTPETEDWVQIVTKDEFPVLDINMSWSRRGTCNLESSEIKDSN